MRFLFALFCLTSVIGSAAQEIVSVDMANKEINDKTLVSDLITLHSNGQIGYQDVTAMELLSKDSISYVVGQLNEDLPEVVWKTFIILPSDTKAVIIYLSFPELLGKLSETAYLVGGIQAFRGIGSYYIFLIEEDAGRLIFKSNEPILNRTGGCESFRDERLRLTYADINGDGAKDLIFRGVKNYYCEEGQSDRIDDNVLREEEITYRYLFDPISVRFVKY
jgi:hypothetical protein